MKKLRDLLLEYTHEQLNIPSNVKLLTYDELKSDGGYFISEGGGGKLYVLRNGFLEWVQTAYDHYHHQKIGENIFKSHRVVNIGKNVDDVFQKLPMLIKKYNIDKIYIPENLQGRLADNATARDLEFDENSKFTFGKYKGQSVKDVREKDLNYL